MKRIAEMSTEEQQALCFALAYVVIVLLAVIFIISDNFKK